MRKICLMILSFLVCCVSMAETTGIISVESSSPDPGKAAPSVIVVSTFPTELTIDGLLSLYNGNYPLQMGAFTRKSNAESLAAKLEEMLHITVRIVSEDGLFKVRINDFTEDQSFYYYIPVVFPAEPGHPEKKSVPDRPVEPEPFSEPVLSDMPAGDTSAIAVSAGDSTLDGDNTRDTLTTVSEKAKGGVGNIFFIRGDSLWLKRFNYFGKSVALVNALIFTIVMCVTTMIILLVVILLNRNRMEKEAKLRQYLLEQYQSLIVDYLFGDVKADKFRPIASDIYRRQVLIDEMIDVSINLKGDAEEKLKRLYMDLKLDSDSLARAYSNHWHVKVKGFRELAFMNIRDANDEIYKALNSRNEILRMEAQIALVRLSEKDPFEFLSQLERPFSLWEQITLHEVMVQHDIPVPEFKRWLFVENPTVVMFALRMIREFRQTDAEPDIQRVLLHRDSRVSHLAVQVAGDLNMRSTLETMKRMYKYQDYNLCLEIVRSMGKMPEIAMMNFLKLVLDKEDDVQLQIEATKAIENMGEEGVKALVKLMKSEYKNYNIIVRHVLDRRIY